MHVIGEKGGWCDYPLFPELFRKAGTEQAMVSLTGCPRVEVDLSITTESEILIPFVSPHSHFNLTTGEGYYGRLIIAVYSPLVDTVGAGKVDCTLWLNLENIDLAFPTGTTTATSSLSPVVQVGKEEVQVEQYRSIAKDVGKVAEFLHAIEDVPVLSTIVKPAAWASDAAASFLKFCGYSKLQSTNTPQFLKQSVTKFMPNYDGVDMSHCLGFEAANAIELMPMVGNDVDEMALAHIVRTPCYFSSFAWSSSQASGTELFDAFVTPNYFKKPITGFPTTPSHLTYVSSLFAYWRGSIDFKFKLVKTKFHSGRLRVYFQPGTTSFFGTNNNYNYSQVIDIRSENEVCSRSLCSNSSLVAYSISRQL